MKRIALITTNKILAQSLAATIKALADARFELLLLFDPRQTSLDAEILKIDVIVIDLVNIRAEEKKNALKFCKMLHETLSNRHLLLLISQDDKAARKMAIEAKKAQIIDDFVFYDTSLEYLFAKLAAF